MASSAPLRRSCSCDQHSHHDSLKGNCSHQRLPACGALSHTGKHPASVLPPARSSSEAGLEGLGNVWLSSCRSTESGDDRPGGRVAGVLSTEGPFQGQNSPLEPQSCARRRVWRPRASGLILRKERAAGAPCTTPPSYHLTVLGSDTCPHLLKGSRRKGGFSWDLLLEDMQREGE